MKPKILVNETCSCGCDLTIQARRVKLAFAHLMHWRENHNCPSANPVGFTK